MKKYAELYRRFKEVCPYSSAPFNPTAANVRFWRDRIVFIEKQKQDVVRVDLTEEWRAYREAKTERAVNDVHELPDHVQQRVYLLLYEILYRYADVKEVWLTGSYVTGSYIDETTDESFKELKLAVKKCKRSDFDFITNPVVVDRFEAFGEKVDLLTERGEKKLRVYP